MEIVTMIQWTRNRLFVQYFIDLWTKFKRKRRMAQNIKEAKKRDPFIY